MRKILYHANCLDGSGAAMVAWLEFGENAEYIPVQYGESPPDVENCEVYILDFSYKREVLTEMAAKAKKIVVIDHHKTAAQDLSEPIPGVETYFDMSKSGAIMTWDYFNDGKNYPTILLHIQDRDLWQWKLPYSKEILKALPVMVPDWRDWKHVSTIELKHQGRAIQRFLDIEAQKIVKTGPIEWRGHHVPVYNLQGFMISETLHLALDTYPNCPFAVAYFDVPDKRIYSLRSRKGCFDVSELAKGYEGGGHQSAAGFTECNAIP